MLFYGEWSILVLFLKYICKYFFEEENFAVVNDIRNLLELKKRN